jgi:DNA-binding response OmpR family regulator
MRFMLETNGYRVLTAGAPAEAIELFTEHHIDLVLADADHERLPMVGAKLLAQLKEIASYIPMILLGKPYAEENQIHAWDATLSKKGCGSRDLLDRIKVMSARKRGPRKGTPSPLKRQSRIQVDHDGSDHVAGVNWQPSRRKWASRPNVDAKDRRIEYFDNKADAVAALTKRACDPASGKLPKRESHSRFSGWEKPAAHGLTG